MRMNVHPGKGERGHDLKALYWRSWWDGIKKSRLFREVQTYCMFIGYPRSGHSLVGSLLDAHRNMVIAHELDALRYLAAGFGRKEIYSLIMANDQQFTEKGRDWTGYQYRVPNQWQGRYERLQVIGDKKGGMSAIRLTERPELLGRMKKTVGVPLKLVHVVRNPFDNITTILTRQQKPTLDESIRWYFDMCGTVARVIADEGESVITVRQEDLIADAKGCLRKLCGFLGVEAGEDYLTDCASIVFSSPKQTRFSVPWSDEQIRKVEEQIRKYEFMEGYGYQADADAESAADGSKGESRMEVGGR
jgi:hypothetical protein